MTNNLFLSEWFLKLKKNGKFLKFPLKNLKIGNTYILGCNKKQTNYYKKKCTLISIKNRIATLELNNGNKLYLCITPTGI